MTTWWNFIIFSWERRA